MRRLLGVLGRPEPDNFIANTRRCFKCVESIVGTAHYKIKKAEHTQDQMLKVSEVSFVQIAKSETFLVHCIHMLDLLA